MSAEENKSIFRRYVEEVVNQGDLEIADEIIDRYLAHQPDGSVIERGPEDVKRFLGEFHKAFPDLHAIIEDQIDEGDRVMTRYRWVVERTLSWVKRNRRLKVRYERRDDIHQAFLDPGCALICWRYLERLC